MAIRHKGNAVTAFTPGVTSISAVIPATGVSAPAPSPSTVLTDPQPVSTPTATAATDIPFTGAGEGVILPPPAYVDGRYRMWNVLTENGYNIAAWYDVTVQDVYDNAKGALTMAQAQALLVVPAIYPPDLPLLQITLDDKGQPRLCWYNYPLADARGFSFVDSTAWLAFYKADGTPSNSTGDIQALNWLYTYVQAYINKFLNSPYDLTALVPYGFNYWDELRLNYNKLSTIEQYLSNLNYLQAPTGHKTFWDGVLNAAPLVIISIVGAALSIASAGALSPIAIAMLAADKKIVSMGMQNTALQSSQLSAPAVIANASGVNTPAIVSTVAGQALQNPVSNPTIFIFIIVIIAVFLLMAKK